MQERQPHQDEHDSLLLFKGMRTPRSCACSCLDRVYSHVWSGVKFIIWCLAEQHTFARKLSDAWYHVKTLFIHSEKSILLILL